MNMFEKLPVAEDRASRNAVVFQRFQATFEYPVFFTNGTFDRGNNVLLEAVGRLGSNGPNRIVVFIDHCVANSWPTLGKDIYSFCQAHREILDLVRSPEVVPGGEQAKNDPEWVAALHRRLHDTAIDRQSFVLAIGGGAVIDLVGYAAATFHRGVRLIRMPTTVLAQDDAGIGVKNGINGFGKKNLIGTFAPPFAVINDSRFLKSLSRRDAIAGMAEAVKVALVRDATFYGWIEDNAEALGRLDPGCLDALVRRCAELHLEHIGSGGDPFESGSARPLDYGHWAAHKLETMTNFSLRHGEAVAISMALDANYAVQAGIQDPGEDARLYRLLSKLGFCLWDDALVVRDQDGELAFLAGLREFQEHLGGRLSVTQIRRPGRPVEVHSMDREKIEKAVLWLRHAGARQ